VLEASAIAESGEWDGAGAAAEGRDSMAERVGQGTTQVRQRRGSTRELERNLSILERESTREIYTVLKHINISSKLESAVKKIIGTRTIDNILNT
jgi:hypothetical protein